MDPFSAAVLSLLKDTWGPAAVLVGLLTFAGFRGWWRFGPQVDAATATATAAHAVEVGLYRDALTQSREREAAQTANAMSAAESARQATQLLAQTTQMLDRLLGERRAPGP